MAPAMQQHLQDKKDKKGNIAGHAVDGRQAVNQSDTVWCNCLNAGMLQSHLSTARQGAAAVTVTVAEMQPVAPPAPTPRCCHTHIGVQDACLHMCCTAVPPAQIAATLVMRAWDPAAYAPEPVAPAFSMLLWVVVGGFSAFQSKHPQHHTG